MSVENILCEKFIIIGRDFKNAGSVSIKIKEILKQVGINSSIVRRVAIAAYEAEMNVVMYANKGILNFSLSPEKVEINVEDEGQGIEDIELAMQEGYSTATEEMREMGFGAGMGLPNIKKNADEFKISSEVGKGTRVGIIINLKKET